MAGSSEPAFLFFRHKNGAVAPVDYSSTFATAPYLLICLCDKNPEAGFSYATAHWTNPHGRCGGS